MNFMPLLNQCELEDELSPIDDLSFDISTSFIYFEMNQIVPSKFNTLLYLVILFLTNTALLTATRNRGIQSANTKISRFQKNFTKFR